MTVAGIVAVALLLVIVVFQVALALGAPWGYAAWGGRTLANFASRPPRERIWGPVALAVAICCGIISLGS